MFLIPQPSPVSMQAASRPPARGPRTPAAAPTNPTAAADSALDTRSEWRTFSNDDQGNDDLSHVGEVANPLLNSEQLFSTIDFGNNAASRDLNRVQQKARNSKDDRILQAAYQEIQALCAVMRLTHQVTNTAKHLFKMTQQTKAFKGKSQASIIASCIFITVGVWALPLSWRRHAAKTADT
jgi:transcription initiation factor TFIIB